MKKKACEFFNDCQLKYKQFVSLKRFFVISGFQELNRHGNVEVKNALLSFIILPIYKVENSISIKNPKSF